MRKRLNFLLLPLMIAFILGLPIANIAHGENEGIGQTEKISNELGAQGKGNAYGLRDKDKDKDKDYYTGGTNLNTATSAAPLPPVLAILALILGFGLKTFRNKCEN
ncbi:MAG: hypothetical protein OCC45_11270 [Desulfotalea sp.]